MNGLPPEDFGPDDVDERYRQASSRDPSRPSAAVRRAVLAHAERQVTAARWAASPGGAVPGRRSAWWRPAVFGTLTAAALAGLLIAPRFFAPHMPAAPAPPAAEVSLAQRQAPAVRPAPLATPSAADTSTAEPSEAGAPASPGMARAARGERKVSGATAERAKRASEAQGEPADLAGERASPAAAERRAAAPDVLSNTAALAAAPRAQGGAAREALDTDPAAELRRAAQAGDLPGLERALSAQVDLNGRDAGGRTALMLAALHGRTAAVAALLAHGADPNAADARGVTPLQVAAAAQEPQMVAALKRYGAR